VKHNAHNMSYCYITVLAVPKASNSRSLASHELSLYTTESLITVYGAITLYYLYESCI